MIVLIPAYEPDRRMADLASALLDRDADIEVVVVDDGSGPAFTAVFDAARAAGAHVLRHDTNLGKGVALRTGFSHVLEAWPGEDVVTADADGQHTTTDIVRIADELRADAAAGRAALVLGSRDFRGDVPLRSRFGNAVSRGLFRVAAGWRASDTQTGLRGMPAALLPWLLELPGDRFEYETEMLLRLRRAGHQAREIPIETVYLEQNASSHFRPIVDSLRVTLPLLLFTGSSLLAFLIDTVALLLLSLLTGWLVASIIAARLLSASVNFAVNRRFVFQRQGRRHAIRHVLRYALLAGALLASNIVWMDALTGFGLPLIVAKVVTEAVLFITSYQVQRRFVFGAAGAQLAQETDAGDVTASKEGHRRRIGARLRMESPTPMRPDAHHLERTP
ncbi:Glycosyltransferase involved in cell wall bisynthesis [Microbacterium sp. cf046]|uniref:bifunctional glycosyltransferase family 2/GtrA family protein n=1 Tax=Microbacterium sp. cf046 TaxID=1761803 RepID=UPI0008DF275D|nr:bifunctional glycosyltransferase family 2/GtrA family protein [Microbacterium sp. cf046]SFS17783.1 Glycosyltransferase involved in cell wall bisynthesis [Microbacterium sp. cf046]